MVFQGSITNFLVNFATKTNVALYDFCITSTWTIDIIGSVLAKILQRKNWRREGCRLAAPLT